VRHAKLDVGPKEPITNTRQTTEISLVMAQKYLVSVGTDLDIDLLSKQLYQLIDMLDSSRIVFVSDANVWSIYGTDIRAIAAAVGCNYSEIVMDVGESSKSILGADFVLSQLKTSGTNRRDILCAVGGGVVCDTVGYCAATYLRGMPYFLVPTSLMAQVDAAIGGKVGIDYRGSKNWLGSFYHPIGVYISTRMLDTLPNCEIANGFAEVVKVAAVSGYDAWDEVLGYVEDGAHRADGLAPLITRGIDLKLSLLAPDPLEVFTLDRALNFGHCIGHAIEASRNFSIRHGEAVAIGMSLASAVGASRQIVDPRFVRELTDVLRSTSLPLVLDADECEKVWSKANELRQVRNGRLRLAMVVHPGKVDYADDISLSDMHTAVTTLNELGAEL
jgi:3-dehydroquinate synthase